MPEAHTADVKRWLLDHEPDWLYKAPPVLNTWYEVFHDYDVRLLLCEIYQYSDEEAARDVEVRWTKDTNVYLGQFTLNSNTYYYVYGYAFTDGAITGRLETGTTRYTAGYYVDERALDFKVEMRMTSAIGTNQVMDCWCKRETLEQT